ncbi:MAG: hypothetical protein ACYDE0_15415 [Acidiferrobacterales bacterium]
MYDSQQAAFDAGQMIPPGAMRACKPIPIPEPSANERRRQAEFMRRMIQQMDGWMDDRPKAERRPAQRRAAPKPAGATKMAAVQADLDGMSGAGTAADAAESGGDDDGGDDGGDPDPERCGSVDAWGNTQPGIDEQIIRLDESEGAWVDELWCAAEHQAQIQVMLVRCPAKDRRLMRCIMAGIPSGRDAKTEKKARGRARQAVRGTTCRPRTLSIDIAGLLSEPAQPLEPSRRGRPKGAKSKKHEKSAQIEMFGGEK